MTASLRYEVSVIVGPCSEEEVDELAERLSWLAGPIGGAAGWAVYEPEADGVRLTREQADTIEAALESARVNPDAPITDPYVLGLFAALALLREAKDATR